MDKKEHSQRQGHRGKFRVKMNLSRAVGSGCGEGRARRVKRRQKGNGFLGLTKMAGLYREEPLGEHPAPGLESSGQRAGYASHTL